MIIENCESHHGNSLKFPKTLKRFIAIFPFLSDSDGLLVPPEAFAPQNGPESTLHYN